jgi:hypothetical protein
MQIHGFCLSLHLFHGLAACCGTQIAADQVLFAVVGLRCSALLQLPSRVNLQLLKLEYEFFQVV